MIYYYARVSTDHQENSAANQRQVFEGLAASLGEDYQIVVDEDVSGSVPLSERPAGKPMWDALKAGDMVVVAKLDRGWRSVEDAARCLSTLRAIGVRLKILDFPVDVSTDEGELMFLTFAGFAQYENRLRGRRVREIFAYRKRNGMPYATIKPFGWVRSGDEYVPNTEERQIADAAASMREDGMSYGEIARQLALAGRRIPKSMSRRDPSESWFTPGAICGLIAARAAGYPIVPRSAVRVRGLSQTQPSG